MTSLVFIVANDIAEVAGSVGNKKDTGGRLSFWFAEKSLPILLLELESRPLFEAAVIWATLVLL